MSGGLYSSFPLLSDTSSNASGPPSNEIDTLIHVEDKLSAIKRYNETDNFGIGMSPAQSQQWYIGRILADVVKMQPTIAPAVKYGWTVAEQIFIAQALSAAIPLKLSDVIQQHDAMTVAIGVTILQGLGIAPSPLPTLKYTQALVQTIGMNDALSRFLGGSLSDAINQHDDQSVMLRANPTLSDVVNVASLLSNHLIVKVTINDSILVHDDELLKMIFNGEIDDVINIAIGYLSPNGQFSTWAMNTRNASVTEYSNYEFNSFAQIGNIYYGASPNGLYQLLGDTDDGQAIIADIKSGFAQWAETKETLVRGVYLGVRGGGHFVLKLITGDGKTYIYSVNARSEATTKIKVGKGIRARYIAFELISTGQDFDLDTVEFVPLISDRRV